MRLLCVIRQWVRTTAADSRHRDGRYDIGVVGTQRRRMSTMNKSQQKDDAALDLSASRVTWSRVVGLAWPEVHRLSSRGVRWTVSVGADCSGGCTTYDDVTMIPRLTITERHTATSAAGRNRLPTSYNSSLPAARRWNDTTTLLPVRQTDQPTTDTDSPSIPYQRRPPALLRPPSCFSPATTIIDGWQPCRPPRFHSSAQRRLRWALGSTQKPLFQLGGRPSAYNPLPRDGLCSKT